MNLLQNKRRRDDTNSVSSKLFPDLNAKISLRFKNNFNLLENPEQIFFIKDKIKNNSNNQINNETNKLGNLNKENNYLNFFNCGFFKNKRLKLFFMPSSFQFEKFMNLEEFKNNNFVQVSHIFDDDLNNNNKNKIDQNLKKCGDENKNIIFNNQNINSSENTKNNIKKQTHFEIKKEVKLIKPSQNIPSPLSLPNTSQSSGGIFTTKNISEPNQKKYFFQSSNTLIETTKPFQTFNAKYFVKSNQSLDKSKSNQAKIFHIEKIFNKKEYRDANEKETSSEDKNMKNRFKISLKKIKQIFTNSCLKIYLFHNDKLTFSENKLNDEKYLSQIIQQVYEIIKSKKISSSKMNEILQVNDDDKYRKHYFMFTSEAKQFCLDLINIKKLSFDIVMKMCKVPRKSLRRWSHVGCNRKKGCGRKTRNPEMENKLVEWYREEINGGANVSAKMIRDKAVEISGDKDFLASKGWLEKFKKKFGIRIATHKNKNFKKIIAFKDKIGKININSNNNDLNNLNNLNNYLEEKDKDDEEIKINLGLNIGIEGNNTQYENEEENEEDKNENENENINELNNNNNDNIQEEKDEVDKDENNENENENGININIINNSNNSDEIEKSDEMQNKINGNINLRKPIFLRTKIDKGNNKKFNVVKLNTIC